MLIRVGIIIIAKRLKSLRRLRASRWRCSGPTNNSTLGYSASIFVANVEVRSAQTDMPDKHITPIEINLTKRKVSGLEKVINFAIRSNKKLENTYNENTKQTRNDNLTSTP
jgi:hypothetical protein